MQLEFLLNRESQSKVEKIKIPVAIAAAIGLWLDFNFWTVVLGKQNFKKTFEQRIIFKNK